MRRVVVTGHPVLPPGHHLPVEDEDGAERTAPLDHVLPSQVDRLGQEFLLAHGHQPQDQAVPASGASARATVAWMWP